MANMMLEMGLPRPNVIDIGDDENVLNDLFSTSFYYYFLLMTSGVCPHQWRVSRQGSVCASLSVGKFRSTRGQVLWLPSDDNLIAS